MPIQAFVWGRLGIADQRQLSPALLANVASFVEVLIFSLRQRLLLKNGLLLLNVPLNKLRLVQIPDIVCRFYLLFDGAINSLRFNLNVHL